MRRGRTGRWLVTCALAAAPLAAVFSTAGAQRPTRPRQPPPAAPAPRAAPQDTARRPRQPADSARADTTELVKWAEPDSVMQALLDREGYIGTRYQGDTVRFDARRRLLELHGETAVQREQTVLVGDSILYNDSTKVVIAFGDTIVLRDPGQGPADLIARGRLEYNMAQRAGLLTGLCTQTEEAGQTWYICGETAGFRTDSTAAGDTRRVFYSHEGTITSCELTEPHYHFKAVETKYITKRLLVARPAVLYVHDIPVMWLPFIVQDMRSGRRSGLLSPRIGLSDIVRSSSSYRRHIEDLGYYFAISDYMDAQVSLDWRSGARGSDVDPGWTRWNGEWRYRWLSRFLSGRVASSYELWGNGQKNLRLSWGHQQSFAQRSNLSADLNYVRNTSLQQRQAFNVAQALATIASRLNFQQGLGPASLSIGGSRTQYPGRPQVQQDFPNITLSTKPVEVGDWLVWSPGLSLSNSQTFNMDQAGGPLALRYRATPDGGVAVDTLEDRNQRQSSVNFDTPLRIFGFDWRNSIRIRDQENDFPEAVRVLRDVRDTAATTRVYQKTFRTDIDWETGFALPPLLRGTWNLTPSVSIVNTDRSAPFAVRTVLTGGSYVRQGKRLEYGLSASPTLFAFLPGIGPIERIRHSVSPTISYSYAPRGRIDDAFLAAINRSRLGYLGDLQQNMVTLGLNQVFEAKLRSAADTAPGAGEKIRLLTVSTQSVSYDFERARKTGRTLSGFTSDSWGYGLRSDLLPGFDVNVAYDLFEGNPVSDTARFKPYRTNVSAQLSFGRDRNPFAMLTRVFGKAVPATGGDTVLTVQDPNEGPPSALVQSAQQTAGTTLSRSPLGVRTGGAWEMSLSFSAQRSRPIAGEADVFDPFALCERRFAGDPLAIAQCRQVIGIQPDSIRSTLEGTREIRVRPQATLRGSFNFNLTPRWAVQWGTGYDFQRDEFSDHIVTLQRDMHDWRAIFAFTQAPNGNFAFNFFIALKAQQDIKFDYNRRTYRPTTP